MNSLTSLYMNQSVRGSLPQRNRSTNIIRIGRFLPNSCLHPPHVMGIRLSVTQLRLTTTKSPKELRYRRPYSANVEDVEKYRKGGYHPIHLGDVLKSGRYSILHKLGHGGFSTVWLARDEYQNRLVSLKVLTADALQPQKELRLLRHLDEHVQLDPRRGSIVTIYDDFMIDGPNGTHLCLVSRPGGPTLSTLSNSPGEIAGSRRLRAPLARKISRQLARAVSMMHDVGIVHGGTLKAGSLYSCADS